MHLNVKSAVLKKKKDQGWGWILVRVRFAEKEIFEQRYDRGEEVRGNSMSKGPEVGVCSSCLKNSGKPGWLEQCERRGDWYR